MKQVDELEEFRKQAEMYFDQALDPGKQEAFLRQVENSPDCQACFHREQLIRDNIRRHIYRPGDPGQLIQAIRNQIRNA